MAYDSESADNEGEAAQDEAAAAAQASGIDMGGYDFGNPGKDDDREAYQAALGRVSKDTYNAVNQITPTNPFGRQGFFSRVFGIDPKSINYSSTYDVSSNNPFIAAGGKYGLFANPFNEQGRQGYRSDVPTSLDGMVRPGLQSGIFSNAGQETALGTLADYDTNFSGLDRLAMAAMPMGFLGQVLGGRKTGLVQGTDPVSLIAGTPVGALMPTEEMAAQGQTSGGIGRQLSEGLGQFTSSLSDAIKTAKSLISDTKAKNATAPQQAQPDNLDRVRMLEALGVPEKSQPPQTNFGIAGPVSMDMQDVLRAIPTDIIQRGIQGQLPKIQGQLGEGQYELNIDPRRGSGQFNFNMPLQDFGLGSLLSDASMLSPNMKRGNLQDLGDGYFGNATSSGRFYQGQGQTAQEPSFFDKYLNFNPQVRARNIYG